MQIARVIAIVAAIGQLAFTSLAVADNSSSRARVASNPERDAYYGDLHLHTNNSLSVYLLAPESAGPDEAYRFAKGEVIDLQGKRMQRREPLDFLAITDQSANLGVFNELADPNSPVSRSEVGRSVGAIREAIRREGGLASKELRGRFDELIAGLVVGRKNGLPSELESVAAAAWARQIESANAHNEPGKFTTFIAFEWAAGALGASLHRNVIFRGGSAPYPFTPFESKMPEDLWDWLDKIRAQGFEALAIPHMSNMSNGQMYDWRESGDPLSPMSRGYAEQRQANEPLSEIGQNKGTSETHPLLSPKDSFANFEIYDFDFLPSPHRVCECKLPGSYLRDALGRGLVLQRKLGVNPFKYGFVGSSDLHAGLSVSAQADYSGDNFGETLTQRRAAAVLNDPNSITRRSTAGNLTAVWAEANTREAIYDALRRREVFATSGTRLKFRFFGGWAFNDRLLQQKNWARAAYASGVPMGADLPSMPTHAKAPSFVIWAVKDSGGANLDRIQIIKVWEEDGTHKEKVFDVAWSGRRSVNLTSGEIPPVGNTVDLKSGTYTNTIGAAELKVIWSDPEFHAERFAAYYLRVLEIPTPRWSTLRANEHGLPLPNDALVEQQRGWSSPVFYIPAATARH